MLELEDPYQGQSPTRVAERQANPPQAEKPQVGSRIRINEPFTPAAQATVGCISNATLSSGSFIVSPAVDGTYWYKLVMQSDGDLVEWGLKADLSGWVPLWKTNTHSTGAHLTVLSNGNLVVRTTGGSTIWQAFNGPYQPKTQSAYLNARLCLQTDGNLVEYTSANSPIWATMTHTARFGSVRNYEAYPSGQCTWWADEQLHLYNDKGNYAGWNGDAWTWASNAHAAGWNTGLGPAPGSVAVYQKKVYGAGDVGHVAWTLDFYPALGKVYISEMNMPLDGGGFGKVDYRTVRASDSSKNAYTGQANIQYIYVPIS